MSEALVLGIETSCDETAVGIVKGRKLLANVISSSVAEHARFGGVVPEIAARAHLEAMPHVIKEALDQAKVSLKDRKSTRLNSSHVSESRMPSSA